MAGGSEPGASLVSRAVSVLRCFDESHRTLTTTEIATRAGLPTPTAWRIVRDLVAEGALERTPDGRHCIGHVLWDLGLLAPVRNDLRETASPYLHDLHAVTRATVHLAVRENDRVLYLDRISGRASVPVVSRVGARLPLHATGVGKVLLAHAPAAVREHVLRDLPRITAYTIASPRVLHQQLTRIRRDGVATTAEEMSLGASSVAVPVHGADGDVIAAMGLVVPTLSPRERTRYAAALAVAAQGVRRELTR